MINIFFPGRSGIVRAAAILAITCAVCDAVVDPPVFTPGGEVSAVGFSVTVASTTPGATLRYTIDGTDPQPASPIVGAGGEVWIGKSVTLKAKAWSGAEESTVTTTDYRITGVIAAGWDHVVALRTTSAGLSWGLQTNGRLGNGSTSAANVATPGLVFKSAGQPLLDGWSVAAGADHSLLVDLGGEVWGFGNNSQGQLGNGGTTTSAYPVKVLKSTTPGDFLTACSAVAAGDEFSVALSGGGQVYAWGSGSTGRLGDGTTPSYRAYASLVKTIDSGNPALAGIVEISTANGHVLAREKHDTEQSGSLGRVWCWGMNTNAQLGILSSTNQTRARNVMRNASNALTDVSTMAAGSKHSAFVRWKTGDADLQGSVWTVGYEGFGALGNGANAIANVQFPVRVLKQGGGYVGDIVEVAAGPRHTLALDNDGFVWSWGANANGEIGDGSTTLRNRAVRVKDASGTGYLSNITKIAAGGTASEGYSIAIAADGLIYSWGANSSGQLGNHSVTSAATTLPTVGGVVMTNFTPSISATSTLVDNIAVGEISMSASPIDPDGPADIARVDFLAGSTVVGSATSAPWSAVWSSVPAGDHAIVAMVTDRAGNTAQTVTPALHVYAAGDDEDGDGLTNAEETELGLDPFDADTDGDEMEDGFEVYYQFPAQSAADEGPGGKGPNDDFDGDSSSNRIEARDGRLPRSAADRPLITTTTPKTIKWFAKTGVHYRLQWSTNLTTWYFHGGTYAGQNKGLEFLVSDVVGGPPPGLFFIRLYFFTDLTLDTDSDGLTDEQETYFGTDPEDSDTDDDFLLDGWEIEHGMDPNDPSA